MPIAFDNLYTYQPNDANVLVLREAANKPQLSSIFKIVEGVKGKQTVQFLNDIEKVTKKDAGCGLGKEAMNLTTTVKTFAPADAKVWKAICWKDFRGTVLEWKLKNGNDKSDITGTDIADTMFEILNRAAFSDLQRMAWFADKNITAASLPANGAADVPYYDLFDGVWKRIFTSLGTVGTKMKFVHFTQNDGANYAAQEITDAQAFPYFQKMFNAASTRLMGKPLSDLRFAVNGSLFTHYLNYRESQNLDNSFDIQESGVTSLKYRGVPIQVISEWDSRIQSDFNNGTKYDKPNRSILTVKDNLQLAFDEQPYDSGTENPLEIWYNRDTEEVNGRLKYVVDSQIADDELMVAGY